MARPLEKTKRDGTLYKRDSEIEAAINAALGQDLETLCSRAEIRNRKAKHYLPSECLVHLIRDAGRRGDEQARGALLSLLLARCAVNLIGTVLDSEVDAARELREDILADFAELFVIDGSSRGRHQLDFFEARFSLAFRAFRITRVRPVLDRQSREMAIVDEGDDVSAWNSVDDQILHRLTGMLSGDDDPEKCLFRKQVYVAIMALPPHERKALVLCRLMGFKEESDDPNERTAVRLCGVTGRTIRNRLTKALAKLSQLKEDA